MELTQEEQALLDDTIRQNDEKFIIPINSKTLSRSIATSRFSSAEWYELAKTQNITLAGCGGIGGYCGFLLSRLGINTISLYDDDTVGEENLSGQLYGYNDIGLYKVNCLYHFMRAYSDMSSSSIITHADKFTSESSTSDIMICGFDNMEARKIFFNSWLGRVEAKSDEEKSKCLYLDGRLNAEEFQIFCIKGNDKKAIDTYTNEWLFSDDEAEHTVCSYKQTTFCANMIASYMVNCFINFVANQCDLVIDRDVPFMIYYDAKQMIFKIIEPWQL